MVNDTRRVDMTEQEALMAAYTREAHRVQTAIAALMAFDADYKPTQPKHMRTGIDMSKSDMGGLVQLLIAKGVFTELEYMHAMCVAAKAEADTYEKLLQAVMSQKNVKTL